MKIFLYFLAASTLYLYGVDATHETGFDTTYGENKSMSVKKSADKKKSDRKFDTQTDQRSSSSDLTIDTVAIYLNHAQQCLTHQMSPTDFGMGYDIGGGNDDDPLIVDNNQKNFVDSAAGGASKLSKVISRDQEMRLKKHIACITYESAAMAQANLNTLRQIGGDFSKSEIQKVALSEFSKVKNSEITDSTLREYLSITFNNLRSQACRFLPTSLGTYSVQCGQVTFAFADNSVKVNGLSVSPQSGNFFGYSTALKVSSSRQNTDGSERAFEQSQNSSREAGLTRSKNGQRSESSKDQTNLVPFMPK